MKILIDYIKESEVTKYDKYDIITCDRKRCNTSYTIDDYKEEL